MKRAIYIILTLAITLVASAEEKEQNMEIEDWIQTESSRVLEKESETGFDSLTAKEKAVFLAFLLEGEVGNGGIEQYYTNTSGQYAVRTVEMFEAIGAKEVAKKLEELNSLFPQGIPSIDQNERCEQFEDFAEANEEKFEAFDTYLMGELDDDGEILHSPEDFWEIIYKLRE